MMDIFEWAEQVARIPPKVAFDGSTYDPTQDYLRLNGQLGRVRLIMNDGKWHTLREMADNIGCEPQSVSARIRDLKKEQYGGLTIEKEHVKNGLWRYRLVR